MKKTFLYIISIFVVFSLTSVFFAESTFAQDTLQDRLTDIEQSQNEEELVQRILNFSIPLSILSMIVLSAKAAYDIITSQGNPEKLMEAKETIVNAILGFVLIVMSVSILILIEDVFNLPV